LQIIISICETADSSQLNGNQIRRTQNGLKHRNEQCMTYLFWRQHIDE